MKRDYVPDHCMRNKPSGWGHSLATDRAAVPAAATSARSRSHPAQHFGDLSVVALKSSTSSFKSSASTPVRPSCGFMAWLMGIVALIVLGRKGPHGFPFRRHLAFIVDPPP